MAEINSDVGESNLNLLDLPDDVLLIILSHLNSNDLSSLARTCSRLQMVTCDKSLWININFKLKPSMVPFLFLYENLSVIGKHTRKIFLTGREEKIKLPVSGRRNGSSESSSSEDEDFVEVKFNFDDDTVTCRENDPKNSSEEVVPKCSFDDFANMLENVPNNIDKRWLRLHLLNPLAKRCPELHTLRLQCMRLFYNTPPILPKWNSLTELSLRGSRLLSKTASKFGPLYDLSVKLPNLICLDIGCCAWVESHCFMAISKFRNLRTLLLDGCYNLGNCVAYTSLAACLGFPAIQELDLRDTQFGDSDLLSFKRNATINKVILGRQIKRPVKSLDTPKKLEESTFASDEPGGSGKNNEETAEHSNGCKQGRKRKRPVEMNRSRWKRTRQNANPQEALVIHVDLGLGIRVEHVHEAGDFGMSLNVDTGIGNSVTDGGIVSLGVDGLPGLTDLVLAGSGSAVTDRSLMALQRRVGLHSLDVRRTGVTEAGIISFLEKCPDVKIHSDFDSKIIQLYTDF